jgi:soluble lytic murein transglycosylase-like protein
MEGRLFRGNPPGHHGRFGFFLMLGVSFFLIYSWEAGLCPVVFSASPSNESLDLKKLVAATRDAKVAASLDLTPYKEFLDPQRVSKSHRPLTPLYSFHLGEIHRLRGDSVKARKIYQGLVTWAAADPYGDGWGASGLISLALWRWVQLMSTDRDLNPHEGEQLLQLFAKLGNTRLFQGMFQSEPIFGALPQLEEDILRGLVSLAWSLGKKEEARRLFMHYLEISRTTELSPVERKLLDESVSSGVLSFGQVALFRGKRLDSLGNYEGATYWLKKASESRHMQVKAEASFCLARLARKLDRKCATPEMLNLVGQAIEYSADPNMIQEALLWRGKLSIREGCPKNDRQFKADLNRLIEEFPRGRLADDALYQLAWYSLDLYFMNGSNTDLEEALRLFAQLREFKGPNDFLDSLRFKPAMGLYSRGSAGDIQRAPALLLELEKERPWGPFHLQTLFWLGRMSAEAGDEEKAKYYFKRIIEESPYDYYAIRARMHLNLGNRASKEIQLDSQTKEDLRAAFLQSRNASSPSSSFSETAPYHLRLQRLLASGVYSMTLEAYSRLRRSFPSLRLEDISLDQLDEKALLPQVGLLLASRQDALAAVDSPPTPANRLEIAEAVGHLARDWPLVLYLSGAWDKPLEAKAATQRDKRFLVTAYPGIFRDWIEKFSVEYKLPEGFIYSVIRCESAFYPEALSPEAALGLFQFTPATFKNLNDRWQLLRIKNKNTRVDFLLEPELNIYLGARYFREELLQRQRGDLVLALLEHISGAQAVKEWKAMWSRMGRENDYEFMIETTRHGEAGSFVKKVLATMWIIQTDK